MPTCALGPDDGTLKLGLSGWLGRWPDRLAHRLFGPYSRVGDEVGGTGQRQHNYKFRIVFKLVVVLQYREECYTLLRL